MEDIDAILNELADPDIVGQSEYRAIFELLNDAASGYEPGSYDSPRTFLLAVLDEVEASCQWLRQDLVGEDFND